MRRTFNRTNLELKPENSVCVPYTISFNRTNLELKQGNVFAFGNKNVAFNRTNLELKPLQYACYRSAWISDF